MRFILLSLLFTSPAYSGTGTDVQHTIEVLDRAVSRLEAKTDMLINRDVILTECPKYIKDVYNIKNPKLYIDYEPGIILDRFYDDGCRIYTPRVLKDGHAFEFVSSDDLKKRIRTPNKSCSE